MVRPITKDTVLCISLSGRPSNVGTRFHNFLYAELDLDFVYKAFTTTDLAAAIAGVRNSAKAAKMWNTSLPPGWWCRWPPGGAEHCQRDHQGRHAALTVNDRSISRYTSRPPQSCSIGSPPPALRAIASLISGMDRCRVRTALREGEAV